MSFNWVVNSLQDYCAKRIIEDNLNTKPLPVELTEKIDKKRLDPNIMIQVPNLECSSRECLWKYWNVSLKVIDGEGSHQKKVHLLDNLLDSMLLHFDILFGTKKLLNSVIQKLNEWSDVSFYSSHSLYFLEQFQGRIFEKRFK
jgi:hypothetical protein